MLFQLDKTQNQEKLNSILFADSRNNCKSMATAYIKFGIVGYLSGKTNILVMFSFFTWVVDLWVSFNYMHSIIIAGPEAYDACSSWSALPEMRTIQQSHKSCLSGHLQVGMGAVFSHELHTVPLNQWGKCHSLSASDHRTQKGMILKLSSINCFAFSI